jgi:serine-type D-Ala-D-Ala carboxypeptidase/endopeptidase (penicillin-binding protein 4)
MRRFFLPAVVLVVVIVASILTGRANDAANPDDPEATDPAPSLGTPLLNVRRAPEWLRQPTNDTLLAGAVRGAIAGVDAANPRCVSVRRDGESIVEIDGDLPVVPGYLQRLATLAAFDTMGSGARGYTTEVVRHVEDAVTEGVLDGDLWLVGGADPVLGTAAYIERFGDGRAHTSLEELAASVVSALSAEGIVEINGSIIGDESKYAGVEREYGEPWWTPADVAANTVGPISALLVNNGFDEFPDEVDPPANRRASQPAVAAAALFTDLIEAAGIVVTGAPEVGDQPDAILRESLASIESPSLDDIAARALIDGTTSEMLFHEVSVRGGGDSSQLSAAFGIIDGLVDAGAILDEERGLIGAADGSGVSSLDALTCRALANIIDSGPESLARNALPEIASTSLSACAPRTLDSLDVFPSVDDNVTAMAGRAVASNGDVLTFVVIVNWQPDPDTGELAPRAACDGILPALLDVIADHPSGPGLDQLEPLPMVASS